MRATVEKKEPIMDVHAWKNALRMMDTDTYTDMDDRYRSGLHEKQALDNRLKSSTLIRTS